METIALLLQPSSNRVYGRQVGELARAELALASQRCLEAPVSSVEYQQIGGLGYLTFDIDELLPSDSAVLSNLSTTFGLFRLAQSALTPIEPRSLDCLPDDLVTIQRYQGKTNEQFTKLLLNVATFASDVAREFSSRRFSVLDPLCGRGTTLNQALVRGWDATGVEIDSKDVEAYATFIQRWLKDHRLKHNASYDPVKRDGRVVARRLDVRFAATKELFIEKKVQTLRVVAADTLELDRFVKSRSADVIATDAPYGVRHGSHTSNGHLERNPLRLLEQASPGWLAALRRGGGFALAWNTKIAPRDAAESALRSAGFEVVDPPADVSFAHIVDRTIVRDVIAARRP